MMIGGKSKVREPTNNQSTSLDLYRATHLPVYTLSTPGIFNQTHGTAFSAKDPGCTASTTDGARDEGDDVSVEKNRVDSDYHS